MVNQKTPSANNNKNRKKKKKKMRRNNESPSPVILQRAAKAILAGKCRLSALAFLKLKKQKLFLRKLARLKGNPKSKERFVSRNKKQVGGILPLLPLIFAGLGAAGGLGGGIANIVKAARS